MKAAVRRRDFLKMAAAGLLAGCHAQPTASTRQVSVESKPPHADQEEDSGKAQQGACFGQYPCQAISSYEYVLEALHGPIVRREAR